MDTLLAFDLGYFAHRLAISEKSITGANDYSPTILYTDTGKKAVPYLLSLLLIQRCTFSVRGNSVAISDHCPQTVILIDFK